jgi:hypothetical protein
LRSTYPAITNTSDYPTNKERERTKLYANASNCFAYPLFYKACVSDQIILLKWRNDETQNAPALAELFGLFQVLNHERKDKTVCQCVNLSFTYSSTKLMYQTKSSRLSRVMLKLKMLWPLHIFLAVFKCSTKT